jgi:hypothetical protein
VVEPASGEHGPTSDALRARDVDATSVGRLTAESIAAADIVIHGIGPARPLPGDAFAVLAAGRLLITNADPGFGLSEGIEHLTAEEVHTACDLVEAVLASPDAFTAMRRAGRLAAARHRAAESYGRVIADLTADG